MRETAQFSLRLSPRQRDRAEKLRPFVANEMGRDATRSDVLRRAVAIGLNVLAKRAGSETEDNAVAGGTSKTEESTES
jgi:hypothetical protein